MHDISFNSSVLEKMPSSTYLILIYLGFYSGQGDNQPSYKALKY